MVVMLHVLGYGGLLGISYHPGQYEVSWLLEITSLCAVNCYVLISGYVGVDSGYRYSSIAVLWLRVLFYSAGISLLFYIFAPELITMNDAVRSVFPVMSSQYWYFTAYFGMFFFIPVINKAVNSIDIKQFTVFIISLLIVFSVIQTFFAKDVFGTSKGYSALWLIIMYILGAYIKKAKVLKSWSVAKGFLLFFIFVFLTWAVKILLKDVTVVLLSKVYCEELFLNYTSPTLIAASICLFAACRNLKLSLAMKKVVAVISPLTFSVYLIHMHPMIKSYIIPAFFVKYTYLSPAMLTLFVLSTSLVICILCYLIDAVRELVFNALKINKLCTLLEKRIIGEVWIKK